MSQPAILGIFHTSISKQGSENQVIDSQPAFLAAIPRIYDPSLTSRIAHLAGNLFILPVSPGNRTESA